MADRNRELVPDNWSLVRERALTTGLCSEGWYSEHSGVCRRAELPGGSVKVKKFWKVDCSQHLSVCAGVSTVPRAFSYEGCHERSQSQTAPRACASFEHDYFLYTWLFPVYKLVGLPSQCLWLRHVSSASRYRLSLGDQDGWQFSCPCPWNESKNVFWL